jgi:hypothetical protein
MAERRTLVEGLDTIESGERTVEEQFVYGKKPRKAEPAETTHPAASKPQVVPDAETPMPVSVKPKLTPLTGIGRVPVGARVRTELATALKRASLERQLKGIEPYSLQDILEEALVPWLRTHGYIE